MCHFLHRAGVVLRKRRKYRGFAAFWQEPCQLQIQSCIPEADYLDRDDDDDVDDDADAMILMLMLLVMLMLVSMMVMMILKMMLLLVRAEDNDGG